MGNVLDSNHLRQRITMLHHPVRYETDADRLKAAQEIEASHEALREERDAARRVAVAQRIRYYPDCEDVPDPLRTKRHIAVGLLRITRDEAKQLFPDPKEKQP